jgi:hypothetical protein
MSIVRENTKSFLVLSVALTVLVASSTLAGATVISVDMQTSAPFSGRSSIDYNGAEGSATLANSIFGSANLWNVLELAPAGDTTTDPTFSDLKDSTGALTGVSMSFTGVLTAANDVPINNDGSNAVENDYFVNGTGADIGYTIAGLDPNTQVALYLYSPNFVQYDSSNTTDQPNRGFQLTANGDTINVPSGLGSNNALAYVMTDGLGTISGIWSTTGNEGDWSGFQIGYPIAATPLPASLPLFGSALALLGAYPLLRRRKSTRCRPA